MNTTNDNNKIKLNCLQQKKTSQKNRHITHTHIDLSKRIETKKNNWSVHKQNYFELKEKFESFSFLKFVKFKIIHSGPSLKFEVKWLITKRLNQVMDRKN